MKFLSPLALALVSGCIDGDIARQFVRDKNATDLALAASESQPFVCAVAIYRTSPNTEPPELTKGFGLWSTTPLAELVSDTAIESRVLRNANECWGAEMRKIGGYLDTRHHGKAGQVMTSFDHGGNIALFDPHRGIFIAIAG